MRMPWWRKAGEPKRRPPLTSDLSVDSLIVGGGVMGVTTAYLLADAGQRVALLERDHIGAGDSGNTTAHLTAVMDTRFTTLAGRFGGEVTRALWDAGETGIQQIRAITAALNLDCGLASVPGYLHLPGLTETELRADLETAQRLDIPADYEESVPFFRQPGIRFPNQARFHPIEYLAGVASAVERMGGLIYESTSATDFTNGARIGVGPYTIEASNVVIATHSPITGEASALSAALLQTKLSLYTSYALCAQIPKTAIADCLYWDTRDPYSYLRIHSDADYDYAIFGGRDHKTGHVDDEAAVSAALLQDFHTLLAERGIEGRVVANWSGQVVETHDGAPFIGPHGNHQFLGTGFSGNGMTFGVLAARMAADWVLGRPNPWADFLSPSRKSLIGGSLDYLRENFDYPYYLIRDHLAPSDSNSLQDLMPGEGRVMALDGDRVAVYCHPGGGLTKLSPVCTHLGCLVHWNNAEHTWDCPCHGSRFHPTGEVLSGPAEKPLKPL